MNDCKNSPERCVLCLDQKRSPVHVQCGHSFCCGCLDVYKSYKKFPWASKCPICRNVLREKKKPTKRKYSDRYSDSNNATIISEIDAPSNSSHLENQSVNARQTNILEEFMALAANYFDDTREDDDDETTFHDYEALDEAVEYVTQDSDTYHDAEYEAQVDLDFVDSYEEELTFSTDSEYEESYYYDDDDEDDDDDYNNYYYFDSTEVSHELTHNHRHMDAYYYTAEEETSFIDVVDDRVVYEADNFDIDWETVIASDVIIID